MVATRLSPPKSWREVPGICREAAIQNSPGRQPWVSRVIRHALKVASEIGSAGIAGGAIEHRVRATDQSTRQNLNTFASVATPEEHGGATQGALGDRK